MPNHQDIIRYFENRQKEIDIFPFIFWTGTTAIYLSLAVSAIGLFIIGAAITLMTGRGVLFSGLRQVLVGIAAAVLTFGVGRLIGVSIS